MPSATDTAAPEDEPPGTWPTPRLPDAFRRAVMRIDADAGIGEFGHVGAADHDEAGPAQPRHRRRIGFRRRGIVERAGAGAGHLALDVEQILDRDGNAGIGRRRRLGFPQMSIASAAASAASLSTWMKARAPSPAGSAILARHSSTSLRAVVRPASRSAARLASVGWFGHGLLDCFLGDFTVARTISDARAGIQALSRIGNAAMRQHRCRDR